MIASHRDGDISYYEELGLTANASPEEIRDAFRLYVRLLHPDQQLDPDLKQAAELQMRKLNRIYDVLSDPQSRKRYDETLESEFTIPLVLAAPLPWIQRFSSKLAWSGAIVISVIGLIWLASDNSAGVPAHAADAATPNPASLMAAPSQGPSTSARRGAERAASSAEINQLRAELRAAVTERDSALRELSKLRGSPSPSSIRIPEPPEIRPTVSVAELPSAPAAHAPALPVPTAARAEKPANHQLAGFWFYVKPTLGQMNKNQALYPPEYIEATIVEDGNGLRGSLRARFEIVDRPISPDVNFTFTGTQNGAQATGPWTGGGGAKGEITLKLLSDNSVKIDWLASNLGTHPGLSSGTAILTRRIE